jgi:LemA protein
MIGGMNTSTIVVIVAGLLLVALLVWLVTVFNSLVRSRNQVTSDWAQVEVQLMRRHDLISNLVETVRGYAGHERATLEAVTQARADALAALGPRARGEAEAALSQSLMGLYATAEAYPQLRASDNFLSLQQELATSEDRIAHSRQFYNDAVRGYHNRIETFPTVIVAGVLGFGHREFFAAAGQAFAAPQIRF